MGTLSIHEKINCRSFETRKRFSGALKRFGRRAFINLYSHVADNKERFGNHGGGVWEMPNASWIEQQTKHLEPRYIFG